ncbi:MAG: serine/threonine protein kinase, partial [Deltaproteobacteria bacterium]|nr:serine/threonine protein kinase [Deltaproteobacteria bacterium]
QPTRAGHLADMRRTPTPGRRTGPPRPAQARPPRPAQAHPTRPSSEAKSADPTPPRKRGPRRRRRRDEPRIDPNLGRVLGSYRILSLIGAGGMGQVYMAEHTMLGRKVALKLLRPEYAVKRDAVHRFFQEARAVNAIDHENIVDITDYVELDSGETFFIMELLEGKDLSDYLRKADQPIPLHQAMDIALQVCDALHAAHGKHIIHRDLKPDNIFIVNSGTRRWFVKLLDFGVAKLQDAAAEDASYQTAVGSVIGTPAYMSPEQASGLPIDHRSDIYSFGAILYEMFTGHPVFRAKSFGEFVVKHMNDQPIPPRDLANAPKLPMALEGVILRCLEKDPDKRYATVADLREDLARATATVETVVKMTVTTPSKGTRR